MQRKKILIIDDEAYLVKIMTIMLQTWEIDVITASNGEEGLAKANSEHPDLILLDIEMPGMDGYDVCVKLKAEENTKKIPVFMFTGQDTPEAIMKAHMSGADDYIVKPVTNVVLQTKLGAFFPREND